MHLLLLPLLLLLYCETQFAGLTVKQNNQASRAPREGAPQRLIQCRVYHGLPESGPTKMAKALYLLIDK